MFTHLQAPSAFAKDDAKTGTVQIMSVQANGLAVGRPGTKITLIGRGFEGDSSITLYTTVNNDQDKCTPADNPASNGLLPFKTNPRVSAQDDGTFKLETTWPDNASIPGTPYYICAIAQNVQGLSAHSFTVAEKTTVTINPTSIAPGGEVTISGSNWLPPQQLNVAIISNNNSIPVVSQVSNSDQAGNFTVTLVLREDTDIGSYTVAVTATNEPTLKETKSNALMVMEAASLTPTTTTSSTDTARQATNPTSPSQAGSSGSSQSGASNTLTFISYALGGLGTMLIIIGIIMFIAYARP
jgi:hypothetical protein